MAPHRPPARRGRRTAAAVVAVAVAGGLLAGPLPGCGGARDGDGADGGAVDDGGAITIGSFDFPESVLLAHLYGEALEDDGYPVVLRPRLGPRELVQPALAAGLVDLVPDYSGAALGFLGLGDAGPPTDTARTHARLVHTLRGSGIQALTPSPAQDTNAIVVTRATARLHDLADVSDLEATAPGMSFGGPPECPVRPSCLAGLGATYGLAFDDVLALDAGGPLTRQALARGYVDVGLLFSTDPAIRDDDLVVLRDDRRLQPSENVTPLVRADVVGRWGPGVVAALDAVSGGLTTTELRAMNARVAAGAEPAAVAVAWLTAEGLA